MAIEFYYGISNPLQILDYIPHVFLILYNIFICISARKNKDQLQSTNLIFVGSILNIAAIALYFLLPNMGGVISTEEELLFVMLISTMYYIPEIVSVFTVGLGLIIYGKRNKEIFENLIKYAGILFMMYYLWKILSHFIVYGLNFLIYITGYFLSILSAISATFFLTLGVPAAILVYFQATRIGDQQLRYAGISMMTAQIASVIIIIVIGFSTSPFI